jgi:hypothetical protein
VKVFVGCRGTGKVPSPSLHGTGPAGANSVFLNRSPSRRRNSQTALTLTPRAASSSFRACNVRCGVWPSRSMMNARCGASTGLRYPPNSPGATEPVAAELLSDRDRSGRRSNGEARAHGAHQDRAAGVGPGADGSQCGVLKMRPVANYTRCPRSRCQPPSGRFQNWCGGQRRPILTMGHFGVADHDKEGEESPV